MSSRSTIPLLMAPATTSSSRASTSLSSRRMMVTRNWILPDFSSFCTIFLLFTLILGLLTPTHAATLPHLRRDDLLRRNPLPHPIPKPLALPFPLPQAASSSNAPDARTIVAPTASTRSTTTTASTERDRDASTTTSPSAPSGTSGPASETSQGKVYSGVGLPLTPRITPGSIIAGLCMMGLGAVGCLVGIRVTRLHIFLSTCFLSGLAVTVLIVYIMEPPVKDAIYVGYVMAAVLTGCVVGGIATLFPEVTENLGCLLGGFALSMWLLCLAPNSLLPSTPGKPLLITLLTLTLFISSFHPLLRTPLTIFSLSFSGSTLLVLGIDCFSRAGLKEFWLYIWDLNDRIFPLSTNSYPHTRGLRVELAVIVLVAGLGILTQWKLWGVVAKRRREKEIEREEEERRVREGDEEAGRRVEMVAKRERIKWESVFGGKKEAGEARVEEARMEEATSDEDTVVGELGGREKRPGIGGGGSESEFSQGMSFVRGEVDEIQVVRPERAVVRGRGVTAEELLAMEDGNVGRGTPVPEVVPLPEALRIGRRGSEGESSSSVGAAVETENSGNTGRREGLRSTQRKSKRETNSSVAATLDDGLNTTSSSSGRWSSDDSRRQTLNFEDERANRFDFEDSYSPTSPKDIPLPPSSPGGTISPQSPLPSVAENNPSTTSRASALLKLSGLDTSSGSPNPRALSTSSTRSPTPLSPTLSLKPSSPPPKPIIDSSDLPPQSSKIVKTYRTNEWAKHLSLAEIPPLEDVTSISPSSSISEKPAKLDLSSLNPAPPPEPVPVPPPTLRRSQPPRSATPANPLSIATGAATRHGRKNSIGNPASPTSPSTLPLTNTLLAKRESMLLTRPILSNFDSAGILRTSRSPSPGPSTVLNFGDFQNPTPFATSTPLLGPQQVVRHARSGSIPLSPTSTPTPGAMGPGRTSTSTPRPFSPPPDRAGTISPPVFSRPQLSSSTPSREDMLRTWRSSLLADEKLQQANAVVEKRRSEMVLGKEKEKAQEMEKKMMGNGREMRREELMRTPEMMEAHREALAKMQRGVEKRRVEEGRKNGRVEGADGGLFAGGVKGRGRWRG